MAIVGGDAEKTSKTHWAHNISLSTDPVFQEQREEDMESKWV